MLSSVCSPNAGVATAMVEGVRSRTWHAALRLLGQTSGDPWREVLNRIRGRGLRQLAALAAVVQCQLDDIKAAAKLSDPHIPRRRDRYVD